MPEPPKPSNSQIVSQSDQTSPKTPGSAQAIWNMLTKPLVLIFVALLIIIIIFKCEGNPLSSSWWKPRARTGFGERIDKNSLIVTETGAGKTITKTITTDKLEPAKTLWDWMGLLLAPATLAVLGFWFQHLQTKAKEAKESADKDAAEAKAKADKDAADKQAEQVRERVADQQREEAIQNYLNRLSELLVDKQLKKLLPSQKKKSEDEAVASATVNPSIDAEAALDVIKARTLSLLRLFDQDMPRKASVLSFLGDADLLVALHLDLSGSNWEKANFKRVNFKNIYLIDANLSSVNLSGANLSDAALNSANFDCANLEYANLSGADLTGADLISADLRHAELRFAKLNNADLTGADLTGADLTGADLTDANIYDVDLKNAKRLTQKQVKLAKNWDKATYSEEFYNVLFLPTETSAK